MKNSTRCGAVAAFLACATCPAVLAQAPQQPTTFELAPFIGYQSSQDFTDEATGTGLKLDSAQSAGLVVDVNLAPDTQLEFLYSKASSSLAPEGGGAALTDIKVEYLHVGAIYVYSSGRVRPFFGATAGATRFSPDAPGLDSDTNFSLGLAGGVKLFLARNIGIRLEARAFATQVDSDSAAFCNNGTCRIFYDGDFIWQFAANAGIVLAF
jgi:opacity protein-like surface antigen